MNKAANDVLTLHELVKAARISITTGRALVIFPEGTRVEPGKKLPYRPGIAALYGALDVPVTPVVHNSGLFWPKPTFGFRKGFRRSWMNMWEELGHGI